MRQYNTPNWTGRVPRTSNEAFGLHYRRAEYHAAAPRFTRARKLLGAAVAAATFALVLWLAFSTTS